jgi:orotate phosphoribosyltransferase
MVEDMVTTGLSSRECIAVIRKHAEPVGAELVGAACLIDRSGGRAETGVPLVALATLDLPDYAPDEVPPALAAIPAVKPGSRDLKR